ncbi:YicC/YloC family endoribonuclease [Tropicimonas sp. S265A]|uniref:YicC/YloC family endoribonuclease n=1 Tax=Tropicimonas sp. S265A TaxID=3415134 RepID=UPI003C7C7D34
MVNLSLHSMTGYATRTGGTETWGWTWELRSVNARGLDIKLRVPDWVTGLEPAARKTLSADLERGNVTGGLRLARAGEAAGVVNEVALEALLRTVGHVTNAALAEGMTLAPPSALDLMAVKGINDGDQASVSEITELREALLVDLALTLEAFIESRAEEGAALGTILNDQITRIAALTDTAMRQADARAETGAARLKTQVATLLEAAGQDAPDPQRIAQELAVLAVKGDVTEEIDRLRAHVAAARDLLAKGGPVGRRLDFLCQEFNREANTLCSKSQDTDLTATGMEIKVVIDQMREQVQNLE